MNELREQKRLLDDLRSKHPGTMAFKTAHRHLAGVADLFIQVPEHLPIWMEIKVEKWPKRSGVLSVNLTALQRQWMNNMQKAGGLAGWAVVTQSPHELTGSLRMYVGTGPHDVTVAVNSPGHTIRLRGGAWSWPFIYGRYAP